MKKRSCRVAAVLLCAALLGSLLCACRSGADVAAPVTDTAQALGVTAQAMLDSHTAAPDTGSATTVAMSAAGAVVSGSGAQAQQDGVVITAGGVYVLSGTLADGRIVVNAPKQQVTLVLQDAAITCSTGSPLYVYKAAGVTVWLPEGTQSSLTDGSSYTFADAYSSAQEEEPNACLYSKADLVIAGSGSLTVNANYNNGITGKDTLKLEDATLTVNAQNHGVNGKDGCVVQGATLTVDCGGDALRSTNDSDSALGFVAVQDATLALTAGEDGIQAQTALAALSGSYTICTGGGSSARLADDASAKGLKAGTTLLVSDGDYTLDCADDALHANGSVTVAGGTLHITTGDDGIHADGAVLVSGGTVDVTKSYEGIEGQTVEITGGTISVVASDDGLNAAGGRDQSGFGGRPDTFAASADCCITISGGRLHIDAAGDGIDSNGDLVVSGGEITVSGPTNDGDSALDYDGTATITGGTLVATGSSGMAQNFGSGSTQGSILVNVSSTSETVTVTDADGNTLVSYTPEKAYTCVLVSCPAFVQGGVYTVAAGSQSVQVTLSELIYGSGGMGGAPGGQPGQDGGFGGQQPPTGGGQPGQGDTSGNGPGGTPPQPPSGNGNTSGSDTDTGNGPGGTPPQRPSGNGRSNSTGNAGSAAGQVI